MTQITLSSTINPAIKRFTAGFVQHVLKHSDPCPLVSKSIDFDQFNAPTHVLAFGKGSVQMTHACIDGLGPRLAGGVVLAPDSDIPDPNPDAPIQYFGVDHPSPTLRNIKATQSLVHYAQSIPADDHCIVCISGGGSAHLCSPKPGVTLEHLTQTAATLNQSGTTIQQLNQTRCSLETLKAGGLAAVLGHVQNCQAVVLSDVLDDDLKVIASGPMMNDAYPVKHTIVGNHQTALKAAADFLESQGIHIGYQRSRVDGDSQSQALLLANHAKAHPHSASLVAGETTVNAQTTQGTGGPCMELALATAVELAESGNQNWMVLGLATDGIDGPTNAAGAIITNTMLSTQSSLNNAQQALQTHDSLRLLDSIGATIKTGPTGTNLNDLCLVAPLDLPSTGKK